MIILSSGKGGTRPRVTVLSNEKKGMCDGITRTIKTPFFVVKTEIDGAIFNTLVQDIKNADIETILSEEAAWAVKKVQGPNFNIVKLITEVG